MTINQPPLQSTPVGAFRFNTDSSKLEYYDGNQWVNVTSTSPEAQTGGTRGLVAGGTVTPGSGIALIDFFNISTTGNAADYGDLTTATEYLAAGQGSSRTRGIMAGGRTPTYVNTIEYLTIATNTGPISNFGDLTDARHYGGITSDGSRAVVAGGYDGSANVNVIDYITIATLGDAKDFGDTMTAISDHAAYGSPTRGVFGGANNSNVIQYVTISTLGNSADFGDLTQSRSQVAGGSNAIRGIQSGGSTPSVVTTIDYVTIAQLGNAVDFGDLSDERRLSGAVTSSTRYCSVGGYNDPAQLDIIEYVQIATTGNMVDFGNLVSARYGCVGANSNGHGGLG